MYNEKKTIFNIKNFYHLVITKKYFNNKKSFV